jgi:GntR family transcriptional regulator/MocR family aminotransferase
VQSPLEEMLRGGHRYEQLAMADFIESGQFSRHLGRMRRLYRDRQQALRLALHKHLKVPHDIEGGYCGLHLTVRLPERFDDRRIAAEALRHRIAPSALSGFAMQPLPRTTGWCWAMATRPPSCSSRWSSGCRNWRGSCEGS